MNPLIKIFLLCPIPEDQKPINEYIGLKKNGFFNWANFQRRVSFPLFFLVSFLIGSLFFLQSFLFSRLFLQTILFFATTFFFFFLLLFFRWKQVKKRFLKSRLFYEEASWYDGQLWEKPSSILKNDRFLSTQQIHPFLEKSRKKIFLALIANIVFVMIFILK